MEKPLETMELEAQEGYTLRLEMYPDYLTTPDDFECYTPKQIEAWRENAWFYVSLRVVASVEGVDLGEDWLGGIEAGHLPITDEDDNLQKTVWVWLDDIQKDNGDYLDGMVAQALENAKATAAKIFSATYTTN